MVLWLTMGTFEVTSPSPISLLTFPSWKNIYAAVALKRAICCCCCCCVSSVMSDSVRLHRQQPTRLHTPGILQARTLEWVAIAFSKAWKGKVKVKSLSRVQLFETPWTGAYQAPPSMGFSKQEYWSGLPLPSPKELTILPQILSPYHLQTHF